MEDPSNQILIPQERLRSRVSELAGEIDSCFSGGDLVLVGVLRGAFIFLADLIRALSVPASVDFIAVASYGGGDRSSGEIRITHDLRSPVQGRDVLIVEDIVDTGRTLQALYRHIGAHRPRSLRSCALLDKPSRRIVDIEADWIGFTIPDRFVVGFGLDHAERFRGLPWIAGMDPAAEPAP